MKKQILLLTFIVLASFASVTTASGQAVNYTAPQPLSCTDDALHPVAGKSYSYLASGTPSGGNFTFWATKDPNFISTTAGTTSLNTATALTTGGGDLISTSTNYVTADAATQVDITWSSSTLAGTTYQTNPTFVAVYYEDPTGCSDNFKVYEINPINGFTVDVLNLNPTTFLPDATPYTYVPEQCPDDVRGATYSAGTMAYDYGTNYLYYEFVAANFTGYWIPSFALSNNNAVQGLTYEYTYATPDTWGATPPTWTALVSGTTQIPIDPSITDTSTGVSVFVRVTMANNNYENLAGQTLTMTVDGQNADGDWDVVNSTCADPSAADGADTANQLITARPTITPGTSSPTVPTTIIPGNEQN